MRWRWLRGCAFDPLVLADARDILAGRSQGQAAASKTRAAMQVNLANFSDDRAEEITSSQSWLKLDTCNEQAPDSWT